MSANAAALRAILAKGSKSFSLASHLLAPEARDAAAAVYAFCRRCDDAVDEVPASAQPAALAQLRLELDSIYNHEPQSDLALAAFADVVRARQIPRLYPAELIQGMAMDVQGTRYRGLDDLLLYCYRVASVVGLMMCHVMGVRDDAALPHAAHLGVALQLTNICRDVQEDWQMGRLYLPDSFLGNAIAADLHAELAKQPQNQGPLPQIWAAEIQRAIQALLAVADKYYASAHEGLTYLSLPSATAIRSARWIYWGIGAHLARNDFDPWRGRTVVPMPNKLALLSQAIARELALTPSRWHVRDREVRIPRQVAGSEVLQLPPRKI